MARLARPKTLLLLLFFVCWVEARNLAFLFFPDMSSSYSYWDALDLAWVHFAITIVTVALAATAASYLWYPRYGWFQVTTLLIACMAVSTVGVTLHMTQHADVARAAFESGRSARGLAVPPERLEQMFQPATLLFAAIIAVVFFSLIEAVAWRRRDYVDARFVEDDGSAA
jgi:hypothetical protein